MSVKKLIILTILFLIPSTFYYSSSCCKKPEPLPKGTSAPLFEYRTLDNKTITLSKFKNKNIVIFAWLATCEQCKKVLPKVEEFYKKYKKKITLISTTRAREQQDLQKVIDKVNKNKITFPVLLSDDNFGINYKVSGVPTIWLIDKELKILTVLNVKEIEEKSLEDLILPEFGLKKGK